MNETHLTMIGNVATDIRFGDAKDVKVASFRLASTARRFDRGRGAWVDADTTYVTVVCWRQLAEHVASSLAKGDPVIAQGRMRIREWDSPDGRRTTVELEAYSVGHDLVRGTSAFRRARPRVATDQPERALADELALAVAREPLDDAAADAGADGGAARADEPDEAAAPAA